MENTQSPFILIFAFSYAGTVFMLMLLCKEEFKRVQSCKNASKFNEMKYLGQQVA